MTVPADDEDRVTAVLWEEGTSGIEVRAAGRDEVALLAYFADAPGLETTLASALAPVRRARLERADVPDVDWVAKFREGFRTFHASGFVIAPPWEAGTSPWPDGPRLIVDPGRAFGTGTHESTRLCLALLRERAGRGPLGRVLDLGTGSGILAVAAVRLGASAVTAVDLDPEAVRSARHHARLNRVALHVVRADLASGLRPGAFDLVLANIAAPLLVERRREILGLDSPAIVLSGLLAGDAEAVGSAYATAGRIQVRRDGEWRALLVERLP